MSEEVKQEKTSVPSEDEIKKINAEIEKQEKATVDSIKRDVKAEVKDEMKREQSLEELKKEAEALKKENEEIKRAQEESIKKLEESMNERIEDIKNMKMGVAQNENPFKSESNNPSVNIDFNDTEALRAIEEESRQAFIEKYGLPANLFDKN